jgi:hypothetical protein
MNETAAFLLLLIPQLCERDFGAGHYCVSTAEAGQVQIFYGTIEYERNGDRQLWRVEASQEHKVDQHGSVSKKDLGATAIIRLNAANSSSYFHIPTEGVNEALHELLGKEKSHARLLRKPNSPLKLGDPQGNVARRQGTVEIGAPMPSFSASVESKDGRAVCASFLMADPPDKAWIKSSHVISIAVSWKDERPDAERFRIPEDAPKKGN